MLFIVIIIALTVIIALASGQHFFCLLLQSGLKGLDVPGRMAILANRWFWLVKDEHEGKGDGKSDSCVWGGGQIRRIKPAKMEMWQKKIQRPRSQVLFHHHLIV